MRALFMASPQLEDGYTKLANELFEAIMRCKLLVYERCVVDAIVRKTYGYNKLFDWIANSQISDMTGIPRPHVTRTINTLKKKKIVTSRGNSIGINKDYNQWLVEWRKLPHEVTPVTSPGNKKLPHQVHTKERKKITKEIGAKAQKDMGFDKYADDYEEGVVDADSGELKKPAKVAKAKSTAPQVFKLFEKILGKYPLNWNVNKTQRQAAENLFTERTLPAVKNALQFYLEHKDEEFIPHVPSPYDLDSKWTKLAAYKRKHHGN
jgi:phage replication O-like protein O